MNRLGRMPWLVGVFGALIAVTAGGCTAQGASQSDLNMLESDKRALQQQLAAMTPTMVLQAGQLAPPSAAAQPAGWDTAESMRGRIRLAL